MSFSWPVLVYRKQNHVLPLIMIDQARALIDICLEKKRDSRKKQKNPTWFLMAISWKTCHVTLQKKKLHTQTNINGYSGSKGSASIKAFCWFYFNGCSERALGGLCWCWREEETCSSGFLLEQAFISETAEVIRGRIRLQSSYGWPHYSLQRRHLHWTYL